MIVSRVAAFCGAAIFFATLIDAGAQQVPRGKQFPPGSVHQSQDLPPGRLRNRIERLPAQARNRAMAWLGNFHFTTEDLNSLQADADGGIYYEDNFHLAPVAAQAEPSVSAASVPVSPFPAGLIFHSRPGAPNILYLNFSGKTVTGTAWNTSIGRTSIPAVGFSTDSDFSTFSDSEQTAIKRIWERVSEDYAPFNVDVTTERPAIFTTRTAEALITRNTDANGADNPSSTAGGVGYISVFATSSYSSYRPVWIYYNNLANEESYIAEAASHEVGHNMGLSHDGTTDGNEYYGGHGSGDTSWGPLMGTGYNRNVSQWSRGEYYLANNTQDDLAIIAGKLGYRTDDHGNTSASATALTITGGTNILCTTPDTDPSNSNPANKGVIERNDDVDVFSFATGSGPINLTVKPWVVPSALTKGGNLDLVVELYNSAGQRLLSGNDPSVTAASIQTNLVEGVYYLFIKNTGVGTPLSSVPTGYTSYASIGQYFISGTITPSGVTIPPGAELQATDVVQPGTAAKQFTVTYSDNAGIDVTTIGNDDIVVTGPNGYSQNASLISIDLNSNGTPRVATYAVNPPGSFWSQNDNGVYTVSIQADTVNDIEGATVPAQTLGTFNVAVARAIYTASMERNPGWTLQGLWQYGPPRYTSGGPTNGYTGTNILAYNLSGNYENRLNLTYATTPPINCSGASTLTLQFRRWLGLKAGDTADIEASIDGVSWTNVWSTTKTVADTAWQEVQYSLPSWVAGSSSVQLRWGLSSGQSGNDIGWNIDDVMLLGNGSFDTAPPTASINVANITSAGASSQIFTVTYSDDKAVSVATLDSSDLIVLGPNGFSNVVDFVGVDNSPDGSPRTATYSFGAPGGFWDAADNGAYQVVLQAGEVSDTSGNAMDETVLGSFTVAISTNHQALAVAPVNFTVQEGSDAAFTIHLAEQPSADVTVVSVIVAGDPNLQIISGATNVFTPNNWSTPVEVRVAAQPDADRLNGSATIECRSDGLTSISVTAIEQDTTTNKPPLVLLSSPSTDATFLTTDTITIAADATDDNAVSKVEFFANNALIGTAASSPYTTSLSLSAGTYSLTAVATDNEGASTTSSPISIMVKGPNQAPAISLTSPQAAEVLIAPGTVSLQASASDQDGVITHVEFFNGSTSVGIAGTNPSQIVITNLAPGVYTFSARATDDLGAESTSSSISITVAQQPTVTDITRNGDSDVLNVIGTSGVPHILETSPDLKFWTPIATNTPVSGEISFTDIQRQPNQFYRVVVRP